jgi:hypothetical protein
MRRPTPPPSPLMLRRETSVCARAWAAVRGCQRWKEERHAGRARASEWLVLLRLFSLPFISGLGR